jgi:hypothetical protein
MSEKLFCTFIREKEEIQDVINILINTYTILNSKIFILKSLSSEEYVCTYNIDTINMDRNYILDNTILVHRKKEFNTLYTINALNELIKLLNNGVIDKNYKIPWGEYKNSILLTQNYNINIIKTEIYKIINV